MKAPLLTLVAGALLLLSPRAAESAELTIHRVPLLLLNDELGATNEIEYVNTLQDTNDWHWLTEILITNLPMPYVDMTAVDNAARFYRAIAPGTGGGPWTNRPPRAPIYFNLFHHQEAIGSICLGFPDYSNWVQMVRCELEELDRRGLVSDQYFSDFMVDVIQRHGDLDIFARFATNRAVLGYHFHPSSFDLYLRTDQIRDLEFWPAVAAYPTWETAYYDWSGCTGTNCMYCGSLKPMFLGGIHAMETVFQRRCLLENFTIYNAPVAMSFLTNYPQLRVGTRGGAHAYMKSGNLPNIWKHDMAFSPDPYVYAYKLLGHYFQRAHSQAWIELTTPLPLIGQMLAMLPEDRAHIVIVHLTSFTCGPGQTSALLDYLQQFTTIHPGSRFISASELPQLVDESRNTRSYAMSDLEQGAQYLLRNWHGRPPAFIVTQQKYLSLASFFRALQTALTQFYTQHTWPTRVTVPDFIPPPLGDELELPSMTDMRTFQPLAVTNLTEVIQGLSTNAVPYVVTVRLDGTGGPLLKINAAELLNGMCTLLLKHRAGETFEEVCLFKGHIIPISNVTGLPGECDCSRCCGTSQPPPPDGCVPCEAKTTYADSRLDWCNQLQLWTLEPLDLRTEATRPTH